MKKDIELTRKLNIIGAIEKYLIKEGFQIMR